MSIVVVPCLLLLIYIHLVVVILVKFGDDDDVVEVWILCCYGGNVVLFGLYGNCVKLYVLENEFQRKVKNLFYALQWGFFRHNSLSFGNLGLWLGVLESLLYRLSLSCFEFSHLKCRDFC